MKDFGKLGSFAGRRAAQGVKLPRPGDWGGGHPLGCAGSHYAQWCFWAESNRVVRLAGDRHVAHEPKHGREKTGRGCGRRSISVTINQPILEEYS